MGLETLSKLVQMRGSKATVIDMSATLEEAALAFATDTNEIGVYTGGAWKWIGSTTASGVAVSGVLTVTKTSMQIKSVLYDNTLASAGSWDVSSIDQTYDHLELLIWARSDRAATDWDTAIIALNTDTTDANYRYGRHYGGSSTDNAANDSREISDVSATTSDANSIAVMTIFIPFYSNSSKKKDMQIKGMLRQNATLIFTYDEVMEWENTAAINRIAITGKFGNFIAGSRLQIVGIKTMDVVTDVTL